MMSASLPPDATLSEVLGARALRTPVSRLWIDLIGGAAILGCAVWARPAGWTTLAGAACSLGGYGAWALAERRLRAMTWPFVRRVETRWRIVRRAAGVIGILGFLLFLFSFLGVGLGRLIS
jgi:hypothetical protein